MFSINYFKVNLANTFMTATTKSLYESRCFRNATGDLIPTFWKPQQITASAPCLFSDSRQAFDEVTEQLSLGTIRRTIALALELEIQVGTYVLDATKNRKELPSSPYLYELLKSAVSDEARHELAFKYAEDAYGSEGKTEARQLQESWTELTNKVANPIATAGWAEAGVFLATLGLSRLVQGPSMSQLALKVAEDESRHVATNTAVSAFLGIMPTDEVLQLVRDTISFVVGDFSVPVAGLVLNKDYFCDCGVQLLTTGLCTTLDDLLDIGIHSMPFEVANSALYSRETAEGESVGY